MSRLKRDVARFKILFQVSLKKGRRVEFVVPRIML
jgi:hypothetical protein